MISRQGARDERERRLRVRLAAVAFELWNELELGERNGTPPDREHLAVRAFALFADPTPTRSG